MKSSRAILGWVAVFLFATLGDPFGRAFAAQLSVTDCEGVPRAARQVEEEQYQTVRLITSSASVTDFHVTLNSDTGAEKHASVGPGGVVTFPQVAPGNWKICGIPKEVSLDEIDIVPVEETNTLKVAAITGGTLVISGIALGSEGSGSKTVTNTDQIPTTSGNSGLVGSIDRDPPPAIEQQTVAGEKKPRPFSAAEDCFDDVEAPKIDPISPAS